MPGPASFSFAPTRVVVAVDNCRRQEDWDVKLLKLRELGPRWVRVTTVEQGQQQSPTVTHGREEPQVVGPPTQAAGMMHSCDSDCGPERHRAILH